jgi:signal transduction histidine kinase/ActR/RegA family two-component response regulator
VSRENGRRLGHWAVVIGLLLAFALPTIYIANRRYHSRVAEGRAAWDARLQVVADGRAALVGGWAQNAVADARVVASFPSVVELVAGNGSKRSVPLPADDPTRRHVDILLESFARLKGYWAVYVANTRGAAVAGANARLVDGVAQHMQSVHGGRPPAPVEVAIVHGTVLVVAAVAVTMPGRPEQVAGFVGVVLDPQTRLYSSLLSEPVLAGIGEILLVSPEAGRLRYISPRPGATAGGSHGFPAVPDRLLAAARGSGHDVLDDRGVPVLVASRPVPGTPWTLLAQVNRDHATNPAEQRALRDIVSQVLAVVAVAAVVIAALSFRRARHAAESLAAAGRIRFLNRLLRTTLAVNELIARQRDRQRLLDETCEILVDRAGFVMAWVGVADAAGRVAPAASAGRVDGYSEGLEIRADDTHQGPVSTAIRERRVVVVEDVATSPRYVPLRSEGLSRGYRGAAAFPLLYGDRVFGAVTVYSPQPGQLLGEEVSLLGELAKDLAFALNAIDRETAHQATEHALAESEAQLRQAQKMEAIGRLAGGVAHDFNNLLTAISGYAELALQEADDRERQRNIREVVAASGRAAALTRQLLAFSRKQVLQLRVLGLDDVVRDVLDLLRRLVGEKVEMVTALSSAPFRVRADMGQLQQVLVNLAVDARDAMPAGGRLVIATRAEEMPEGDPRLGGLPAGPYVLLDVQDAGEGMTVEVLQHLFEPFFTTKEPGKGTGLGLSTVYGIVKQLGGAITVESVAGHGAAFRIVLPAVVEEGPAEAAVAEAPPPAPAARLRDATVLVVEDNEGVRAFVHETLRRAGCRVLEAESAERATDVLLAFGGHVDLLLTDVVLPGTDGHQLAHHLRVQQPGLRVLFMSGYADSAALSQDAWNDGADVIEKPFSAATLVQRVRTALEGGGDGGREGTK